MGGALASSMHEAHVLSFGALCGGDYAIDRELIRDMAMAISSFNFDASSHRQKFGPGLLAPQSPASFALECLSAKLPKPTLLGPLSLDINWTRY